MKLNIGDLVMFTRVNGDRLGIVVRNELPSNIYIHWLHSEREIQYFALEAYQMRNTYLLWRDREHL